MVDCIDDGVVIYGLIVMEIDIQSEIIELGLVLNFVCVVGDVQFGSDLLLEVDMKIDNNELSNCGDILFLYSKVMLLRMEIGNGIVLF